MVEKRQKLADGGLEGRVSALENGVGGRIHALETVVSRMDSTLKELVALNSKLVLIDERHVETKDTFSRAFSVLEDHEQRIRVVEVGGSTANHETRIHAIEIQMPTLLLIKGWVIAGVMGVMGLVGFAGWAVIFK